jgi:hypothetical protein
MKLSPFHLIGYEADSKKQLFDWPNYTLTHAYSAGTPPAIDLTGSVLKVYQDDWEVVESHQGDDNSITLYLRKAKISD